MEKPLFLWGSFFFSSKIDMHDFIHGCNSEDIEDPGYSFFA